MPLPERTDPGVSKALRTHKRNLEGRRVLREQARQIVSKLHDAHKAGMLTFEFNRREKCFKVFIEDGNGSDTIFRFVMGD